MAHMVDLIFDKEGVDPRDYIWELNLNHSYEKTVRNLSLQHMTLTIWLLVDYTYPRHKIFLQM